MGIQDINTRGSEHFPMMEKVRGVRHQKKVVGAAPAAAALLAVAGALLILLCSLMPPLSGRGAKGNVPQLTPPAVSYAPGVTPSTEPSTEPSAEQPESPSPEPSTDPSTSPSPSTSPTPTPEDPVYIVIPFVIPDTSPTVSPSPTPSPSAPTIVVNSITYWKNLHRAGMSYTVNANGSNSVEYSIMAEGGGVSLSDSGSTSGYTKVNGSYCDNGDEAAMEDGIWSVGASMQYRVNAGDELTSTTTSSEMRPTIIESTFANGAASATGSREARNVSVSFDFDYSNDDRHTYNMQPSSIGIQWMAKVGDSTWIEVETGETIWPLDTEPCPVTITPGTRKITFSYNPTFDFSSASGDFTAVPDAATHFVLYFQMEGNATDNKDSTVPAMKIYSPTYYETSPIAIEPDALVSPTIEYGHLWYWGEFNPYPSDPGFRLIELQCAITPNDATNITVDATISSDIHSETYTWTGEPWTGGSSAGTMTLNKYAVETPPFCHSTDTGDPYWAVTLVMHYTLGSETKTETLDISASSANMRSFSPETTISHSDGVTTFTVGSGTDDPYTYNINGIAGIYVSWYTFDDLAGYYSQVGTEQTIYPGGTLVPTGASSSYTHTAASMPTPPSGATHMMVRVVTTSPYTGDTSSGRHEESNGPLEAYSEMIPVSTSPSLGNYITGTLANPLPGHTHGMPSPDGFRAQIYLDETVVGRPSTTQPYDGGKTLDVTSVNLTRAGGTAQSISVDNVVFYPVESPYLTFDYNAPAGEPLALDDYSVEVELNYNSPNEDPPVVNLVDTDSVSFSVVPDQLLGAGGFMYSAGSYLGGSIELLNGITTDQLDNFEFTFWRNWSVITGTIDPNAHKIPPTGVSADYVGFEFSSSSGDTVPALDVTDNYFVSVRATYKGVEYTTDRIPIEMAGPTGFFGTGGFTYDPAKGFNGQVELLNGATFDNLTNLVFTVQDTAGHSFNVPAGNITHDDGSGSTYWVCFNYGISELPTLEDPATVTVSAEYGGKADSAVINVGFLMSTGFFGTGGFTYDPSIGFDGTVELLNGATFDNLTNLVFTVQDTAGHSFNVPAGNITHDDGSGSWFWVGFNYGISELPTLEDPATVTVSAEYGGKADSAEIDVEFISPSPSGPITMEVLGIEGTREGPDFSLLRVDNGQIYFSYDTSEGVTYTVVITGASIQWIREDEATTEWQPIPGDNIQYGAPSDLGGSIYIYFDMVEGIPSPSTEYTKFRIQITAHVAGDNGYDTLLSATSADTFF